MIPLKKRSQNEAIFAYEAKKKIENKTLVFNNFTANVMNSQYKKVDRYDYIDIIIAWMKINKLGVHIDCRYIFVTDKANVEQAGTVAAAAVKTADRPIKISWRKVAGSPPLTSVFEGGSDSIFKVGDGIICDEMSDVTVIMVDNQ